jgi:hypothetical protein
VLLATSGPWRAEQPLGRALAGAIGRDLELRSVGFPGAQGSFSFVDDPIALVGRGVPGVGYGVTLVGDVVSAVGDEIALVGRPPPLVSRGIIDHVNPAPDCL